jgi:hypothetical protein
VVLVFLSSGAPHTYRITHLLEAPSGLQYRRNRAWTSDVQSFCPHLRCVQKLVVRLPRLPLMKYPSMILILKGKAVNMSAEHSARRRKTSTAHAPSQLFRLIDVLHGRNRAVRWSLARQPQAFWSVSNPVSKRGLGDAPFQASTVL